MEPLLISALLFSIAGNLFFVCMILDINPFDFFDLD